MVINMKESKRKNMKKTIIKRWVWILIAIMLCIVFAILLNKLQPFGTFLPALEECDVLAIQVTESTDVDGSFVYYYSEDSSEIKSFCDAVSTAKVSISGLHHGHKLIEYEEKMYDVTVWTGVSEKISFILTDNGTVHYGRAYFAFDDVSTVEDIVRLIESWEDYQNGEF